MRNWLIAVFTGILAILVAAGCGGGGNTSSITKAELIQQGDQICKEHKVKVLREVLGYAKEHGLTNRQPSPQDTKVIAEKMLIPSTEDEISELRDLGAPSGEEAQVDKIFTAVEEALEEVKKEPEAILSQGSKVYAEANKLAREYGFKVCGSS